MASLDYYTSHRSPRRSRFVMGVFCFATAAGVLSLLFTLVDLFVWTSGDLHRLAFAIVAPPLITLVLSGAAVPRVLLSRGSVSGIWLAIAAIGIAVGCLMINIVICMMTIPPA